MDSIFNYGTFDELNCSTINMRNQIVNIGEIKFGLHSQSEESGDAAYLLVRQFDDFGRLVNKASDFIKLDEKSAQHLLKDGDVLFVGKGNRLFAWCYRNDIGPAIASSVFFVLRPDQQKVYPEYLATMLNRPQSKAVFMQIGGGTNIFSIRKSELGAFEIPLPSMKKQKQIAAIAALHQEELHLLQQLIDKKINLYTGTISKLVNN